MGRDDCVCTWRPPALAERPTKIQITTQPYTLWAETQVRLSEKQQRKQVYIGIEKKNQVARMCSSAAWQRLERFLQMPSWNLVDDLGSSHPRTETREEMLVCSACRSRANRKMLREERSAVHEVLVEEEYHGLHGLLRKSLCSSLVSTNFSNLTATHFKHRDDKPPPCA